MTQLLRRAAIRAAIAAALAAAFIGGYGRMPGPGLVYAGAKVQVTYDCGSAGTVEISGHPNAATAYPIVGSAEYHTFVGHEFWIYDSAGNLTYHFTDGTEGSVPDLVTCTAADNGNTIVVLATLH